MFTSNSFYRGNCLTNFVNFMLCCVTLYLIAHLCVSVCAHTVLHEKHFLSAQPHICTYSKLYCRTTLLPRQISFEEECKRTHKFTQLWPTLAFKVVVIVGDWGWCIQCASYFAIWKALTKTVCIVVRPIKSTLFEKFFATKSLPNACVIIITITVTATTTVTSTSTNTVSLVLSSFLSGVKVFECVKSLLSPYCICTKIKAKSKLLRQNSLTVVIIFFFSPHDIQFREWLQSAHKYGLFQDMRCAAL